ncbi:MAG: acetyl-CoA carboxylase biotin carboxyl carrier protein subunit [Xanthomonadaceae bacterium]|nr:acetyl-CoA carboxylase biotin carboxyl carrier protein subunit [Xanthomonadaceae bacterium]
MVTVAGHKIEFLELPRGDQGEVRALVSGKPQTLRWKKDNQGIWIEFQDQIIGLDLTLENRDEGGVSFSGQRRFGEAFSFAGVSLMREGDELIAGQSSGKKKSTRIKAQMPGKIIKILVTAGNEVNSGDPLLVMEAMKMENEIKANSNYKITEVKIQVGQAVETGAELITMEPIT